MSDMLSPTGIVNPAVVAADLQTIFGKPNYRTFADAVAYGLLYTVADSTYAAAKRADALDAKEFRWTRSRRARWAHKDKDGLVQMGRLKDAP